MAIRFCARKENGSQRSTNTIRELAANMIETMHVANGVGLAAQQVGEALQLTVIDVAGAEDQASTMKLNGAEVDPKASMPLVLLNPEADAEQGNGTRRRKGA